MTVAFFIENVGNFTMKQMIGIPMEIDLTPSWPNLYLCSCKEEYMSSLISFRKVEGRHFHCTKCFTDDLLQ